MRHKVLSAQNISRMCHVCGVDNASGLHARFFRLESGDLAGVFMPSAEHQGYPGRLHGGLASAILDETMGRAVADGVWGVTVELSVRFRKPVPLDREVVAIARITRDTTRVFEAEGEILLDSGTLAVEATGRYVKMPIDEISGEGAGETQIIPDVAPLPPFVS